MIKREGSGLHTTNNAWDRTKPWGSFGRMPLQRFSGFLKGTTFLFLPCCFCLLNGSRQDKCPSPPSKAMMNFPFCGFQLWMLPCCLHCVQLQVKAVGGWLKVLMKSVNCLLLLLQCRAGLWLQVKASCRERESQSLLACDIQLFLCPQCFVCSFRADVAGCSIASSSGRNSCVFFPKQSIHHLSSEPLL